jgi:hypothetical protein
VSCVLSWFQHLNTNLNTDYILYRYTAVNVSVGGKLTIAQYTTRRVECGEELCWNYSCVTAGGQME